RRVPRQRLYVDDLGQLQIHRAGAILDQEARFVEAHVGAKLPLRVLAGDELTVLDQVQPFARRPRIVLGCRLRTLVVAEEPDLAGARDDAHQSLDRGFVSPRLAVVYPEADRPRPAIAAPRGPNVDAAIGILGELRLVERLARAVEALLLDVA